MTEDALKVIDKSMNAMQIPYSFDTWKGKPPDLYYTGEYQETPSDNQIETGYEESLFTLTGFARGNNAVMELERTKETIKRNINQTAVLPNGNGIAVFYNIGYPVDTGVADIKRMDIKLTVKEWRVN